MKLGALLGAALLPLAAGNIWLDLALKFQEESSRDSPVNENLFPCTHNSYNTPEHNPPELIEYQNLILFKDKVVFENQRISMTAQLDLGVRRLLIDAHYIPKYNSTYMCHGSGDALEFCPLLEGATGLSCFEVAKIEDLGDHTGCTTDSLSWEAGIQEIATWVSRNPYKIVVLEIEDQVTKEAEAKPGQLFDPIVNLLGSRILTNENLLNYRSTSSNQWPTPNEMISRYNKSVIITGLGGATGRWAAYDEYDLDLNANIGYPDNLVKNFDDTNCDGLASPDWTTYTESAIRVVIDLLGIKVDRDGRIDAGEFTELVTKEVVKCGFSPCMDLVEDKKLSYVVWSWKEPYSPTACEMGKCVSSTSTGWTHEDCSLSQRGACKSNTNSLNWVLSLSPTTSQTVQCPAGYTFSIPQNPREDEAVKTLISANGLSGVWVKLALSYEPDSAICSYVPKPSAASLLSFSPLLGLFVAVLVVLLL